MGYIENAKAQERVKGNLSISNSRFRADSNGVYFLRTGEFQAWDVFFNPTISQQKPQIVLTENDLHKICLFYSQYVSSEIFFLYVDSIKNKGRAHLVKGTIAQTLVKNITIYVDRVNRSYQKTLSLTLLFTFLPKFQQHWWLKFVGLFPPQQGTNFDQEIHRHFAERDQQLFAYNVGLTSVRGKRNPQNRKGKRAKKKEARTRAK
jgi:hypothetical protein